MTEIKNYRPISLLRYMYKIFMKILQKQLERQLDENQPANKQVFLRAILPWNNGSYSCDEPTVRKIIRLQLTAVHSMGRPRKALDSVHHRDLLQALWTQGNHENPWRIIRLIYQEETARIQLQNPGKKCNFRKESGKVFHYLQVMLENLRRQSE